MKQEIRFEEVALELEETTGVNIRAQMQNNEEAIQALSAFAQPIRPLELVQPPKPVKTAIQFVVNDVQSEAEIRAAKRSQAARQISWFDLLAFSSVAGMAFAKFGGLDLASLWT